jgi:ABC-type Fe3+ transport system permease subunit
MLAYDYPAGGVFVSILYFFIFFIWIMLLFRIFGDIFRSHDMGGFAKAIWLIFVIVVPFLGVFVYLIARGRSMGEREVAAAQAQQEAFKTYVQQTAGTAGTATTSSELASLAELKQQGVLTDAEFEAQKAKLLA